MWVYFINFIAAFFNCVAKLVRPGVVNCHDPLYSDPYCDISCDYYEEYENVAAETFKCVNGTFASPLPHCAVVDTNGSSKFFSFILLFEH